MKMKERVRNAWCGVLSAAVAVLCAASAVAAEVYRPTQIVNGDFSKEPWMDYTFNGTRYTSCPERGQGDVSDIAFNGVDGGWNTTETQIFQGSLFEYACNDGGVHGTQHNGSISCLDKYVEMNCFHAAILYQDLTTHGGDIVRWSLKHAVRTGSSADQTQSIRVEIGAPLRDPTGAVANAVGTGSDINSKINPSGKAVFRCNGVVDAYGNASGVGFAGNDIGYLSLDKTNNAKGWWTASGVYIVPDGQTVTRFGFVSEAQKPDVGNLLDDIVFSTLLGNLQLVGIGADGAAIMGYWGDADATKRLAVKVGSKVFYFAMGKYVNDNFLIVLSAEQIGDARKVTVYHEDYPSAAKSVELVELEPAGLPYGGDLSSLDAGQMLTPGFFYNLTSDLVLKGDVTRDNPYGSGLLMPKDGSVAINLNGYSLTVEGAAGEGTRGGGAGILMNNGSTLYICGNGGSFTAKGGAGAAGASGAAGGNAWHTGDGKSSEGHSGGGGTGGAGGGGGGAGVGTVGGEGGSGAGAGGVSMGITGSGSPHLNGDSGKQGADGSSASSDGLEGCSFMCVASLESTTLTGGAAGAGGAGGPCGTEVANWGAEGRWRTCAAGGGGGGGGGGLGGAGYGTGGGGGGQGGGGGSGGCDTNDADKPNYNRQGGGKGGYGGLGGNSGKQGADAWVNNLGENGQPGPSGASGGAGAGCVSFPVPVFTAAVYSELKYAVTLDNRGGEGATSTVCFLGETPGAVAVPVRTGYAFGGYFTELDGQGICWFNEKGQGMRLWNTDIKTLYAKWTICSYTVTFDRQGGTGGSTSATATYGAALPSVTTPTRISAIFQGYFTEPEGRGTQYYDGNGTGMRAWDIAAATTLYANWEVFHYTVTLDAQGGGGGLSDFTIAYGEAYPKVSPLPTKTGHTFLGYYEGTDEEAVAIYNSRGVSTNVYEKLSDSTLWAKWRVNTYTLTLDGGSFTGKVSVTYGMRPQAVHVPVREGYVFSGYVNGEGVMVYGADGKSTLASYETAANQDLTALWERLPEVLVLKSAKQRWPWNGKYDVTYEVDHLDPEKRYAIAGDFTLDEISGTAFADIPTKSGEGTVMLDAGDIFPAETLTDKATLTLRLVIRKGE